MPEQEIRFCATSDGVRIAYATVGHGPPLVKAANWLTHLEFDWQSPVWRHLYDALAANHTLVRYDERGTGLSDRHIDEVSLEGWVSDLEAVVDALELDEFDLLGISQGGPAAAAYAVRHPQRVSRLVLYGTFARFPGDERVRLALLTSLRAGWGRDNPAFRQLFTSLFIPEASTEQMGWFNELERVSAAPETAAKILEEMWRLDVRDILPGLKTPAVVIHRKGDGAVPFEMGRRLARLIPNARFIPMEGNNHLVLEQEPEFETFLDVVEQFLGQTAVHRRTLRSGSVEPEASSDPHATRAADATRPASFASGRYVVRRLLGEGGQKTVYLARDTQLERDVALAVFRSDGLDTGGLLRLRREARTLAGLGAQPYVVTVFDIGEEDGTTYVVSEFVAGGDLQAELRTCDGPLPVDRALAIAQDLCRALIAAHEHGILHRDIKPANIWLTAKGTAKLGDFGLAAGEGRTRITQTGTVLGTASYMPPEQAISGNVDARGDLYALGCVLYEMLTGRPPFLGDDMVKVISQHINAAPAAPSSHNPAVPQALDTLVLRLLAKAPAERPGTAAEVLDELQQLPA